MQTAKLLLASFVMGLLGNSAVVAQDQTATPNADLSGNVTVWAWNIAAAGLQGLVQAFNEQYPNVTVSVEDIGNDQVYQRGLAACAAGGQGMPDIYALENNEAQVFWARFPTCFTDLTTLGFDMAEVEQVFPEFKLAELRQDGQLFAIPWDSGPVVYFYRRDIFEQAGVDPASIETWDDLIAAGQKIKEATGMSIATINPGGDDDWFRMLANQAGCFYFNEEATEVTVNQPGCVQALEQIKELADAGVLATGDWDAQIQNIKGNVAAGALFGAWYEGFIRQNAAEQSGNWGIIEMPALEPGGNRAANIGGSALAIPSAAQNKEAAAAFVRFALMTPEGQVAMLESQGLVPSLTAALEEPYLQEGQEFWGGDPIWQTVLGTLENVDPASGTQYFQDARDIVRVTVNDYVSGATGSAQEALDNAAQQISSNTGLPVAASAAQ